MDISVVIVNYNVRYFLEQCILSIIDATKNLSVEVIVVDNNSTDESVSFLQKNYPNIILIVNKENVGFSKANNQGVAISKGEYVLILNPDTVVAEDTLETVFNFAKTNQNIGILGTKLIDGSGCFLPESKRGIPTPSASFNKLFGISNKQTGKYYATHLMENESGVVAVLVGAFMFLKKSIYNEVKGFDEDYFMYGEDIDLCFKVLNKGYQNYYFAETQIIHYKGESTKKDIIYLKYFHNAMKIFYKKHFKLNRVYDFFMSLGIEFWYLIKYFKFRKASDKTNEISNVLYFGKDELIINHLNKKYLLINNILIDDFDKIKEIIKNNAIDTIVFDNAILSNKKIIAHFELLKNEQVSFKIHPRTTNFLIGSNNSEHRGKVELIYEI
ncbi:glycosyltransferase family 2 protein [Lutibacter sp.]|uniref:glycosyltransferase family 2 protein n=1 Tax=Lutibacter sp. TaxID=1925666 RepID=UPI001A1E8028|nr:glycosyltransferase family 2 protein [Lutibacter sp.]MBI9041779.1 glycosyltransferase family 2 protein [Lutibacter sp.]